MTVFVFGDQQAASAAGYIAAASGRAVQLGFQPTDRIRAVSYDGLLTEVDIDARPLDGAGIEAAVLVAESRKLKQHIEPQRHQLAGVPLLLAPGGFGGVLRVLEWFREWGLEPPRVAEATGFPVSGTVSEGVLTPHTIKRRLPMAAETAGETRVLHAQFVRLLPELVPSELVTTSLSNTNHMIHPGVVLLNAARIQNAEPFSFYRNGISPAVGALIEAVDAERLEIVRRLGAEELGVRDWLVRFYGQEGMAGDGIIDCLQTFANFERVPSPPSLDYRYVADDVPFGVAQWGELARGLGITTPHLDGLLTLLRSLDIDHGLDADVPAARLFQQFLHTSQGAIK
ncbi:NAD/NADP octopine/nopaline dehydrogenase family protein [Zafaria sp. J156]|uniref:NAD/NADP octopine/nopaline dehydrogenase family protein n=1 Tax=Zafaria sp. J156 TaxID=3116490 RepID=UPI002E76231B|nr:NAD/NADP octopine/nopaline dehydrogenase family protein [Zafaria sp. J156]MEE1622572.1 NAD/NADP octopine/nopaline dehydrogenase family protein [Zafaria sp. J156]